MENNPIALSPKLLGFDELVAYVRRNGNDIDIVFRFDYDVQAVMGMDCDLYTRTYASQNNLGPHKIGNPIVFIPESGHKAEYFDIPMKCFEHPDVFSRPLNGKDKGTAGFLFKEHCREMLALVMGKNKNPLDGCWHPLIVANACRYQCSLGKNIVDNTRDENFLKIMLSSNQEVNLENLVKRIQGYHPYMVICACTKGGRMVLDSNGRKKKDMTFIREWLKNNAPDVYMRVGEISLRGVVELALRKANIDFVCVPHPCLWYSSRGLVVREPPKLKRLRKDPRKKILIRVG